jgi:hypothetical protein
MAPITPKIFSGDPFYYGFGQGSMDFLSTIGLVCEKKNGKPSVAGKLACT